MKKNNKKNKNITPIIGLVIVVICILLAVFFLKCKQDIYKFDFFDGYEPGSTFKGEINLSNGKVDFAIIHGCSLPNPEECPSDTIVKGTLNKEQLELVKTAFEKINRQDNPYFLTGVSYLIEGDKSCDDETNETCVEIGKQIIESLK